MPTIKLRVEFLDYWHVGSGRGRGTHLDAVVDLDSQGLPYVPGKMLKGLLRNAALCLAEWEHANAQQVSAVFGSEIRGGEIAVSDARLPKLVADYLADDNQSHLREQLFAEHFSTAVDESTGSAISQSLRGIELVIPCTLYAEMDVPAEALSLIEQAMPLVRFLGAHRSRGLGRCELSRIKD